MPRITEYGHLSAELYNGDKRQDIFDLYLQEWEDKSNPVLSAMCGTGDFMIRFAEQGADIDGMDASEHMLDILKHRCKKKGLMPGIYQQLIQELSLPRQYGYVFLPDGCFGFVADKNQALASLRIIWKHMLKGGKLVLDVKQPRKNRDDTDIPKQWRHNRSDGSIVHGANEVSHEEDGTIWRIFNTMELWKDNELIEEEVFDYRERLYKKEEFLYLLKEAGFHNIQVKRAWDREEPNDEDDLLFLAYKP